MGLTKAAVYGICGLVYLAKHQDERLVSLTEVACEAKLPKKFLAKIFQSFVKCGLVKSYRGVKGGFRLGRLEDKITLREILECIQGPIRFLFLEDKAEQSNATLYRLKEVCREIEQFCQSKLESMTLVDLI